VTPDLLFPSQIDVPSSGHLPHLERNFADVLCFLSHQKLRQVKDYHCVDAVEYENVEVAPAVSIHAASPIRKAVSSAWATISHGNWR
jgi:hypothetical protein